MIYPNNFEAKLFFSKVREMIMDTCLSPMGRERVEKMSFSTDYDLLIRWLKQTDEMMHINEEGSDMPVAHFFDLRKPLKKLRVEGLFLETRELFDLRRSLGTVRDILRFIQAKEREEFPALHELTASVTVYPAILEKIDTILNKEGEVKDHASPELARIRRTIHARQSSISSKMAAILKRARQDGLVEADATISIRDGRAVIPVVSANKRKIPGIVQDESSTGKTSYIEPAEIVEINNEIRELHYAEKREVARILSEVAAFLRPYQEEMLEAYHFLGLIDFIRAKARFSQRINAIVPSVKPEASFIWDGAIHPLLYLQNKALSKPVVPLDIELNEKQRLLVISGPNAGGKSVCLQTVGLLQYMLQCGLPVPVKEGSVMGMFDHIFMDIGDEQSIENDLSTYSSHLLNMKIFLRNSNPRSLLLIDEFGTGTEPMLGGAIAETVLDHLNRKGVFGVITTHYTNLKHFASEHEGIANGAMLFDTHRIQPLFKLEIGQPGSSFAFEIAHKIGLPEEVLTDAKGRLGEDHINFDKHLREIIRDKRYWEQKRQSVRDRDKKLEKVMARYQMDVEKLKLERAQILDQAKREARELLTQTNREIENTIRGIREAQAEKQKTRILRKGLEAFKEKTESPDQEEWKSKFDHKVQKIKERQNKKEKKQEPKAAPSKQTLSDSVKADQPLAAGDTVRLEGQAIPGEIMEINGTKAMVAFGQLITNVKTTRLTRISRKEYKRETRQTDSISPSLTARIRDKKLSFRPDIDVRGMRTEEAIQLVLTHLDEALLCGANTVKILHGKGNGILRQMIRQQIDILPFVNNYRDEDLQFGGSGITIVDLG